MSSLALLRTHLEGKFPTALRIPHRAPKEYLPTGIAEMDAVTGGVPKGALSEICGPAEGSSGKTTVLLSLLAGATKEHFCALVDATDSFYPACAQAAGVNFSRLYWVRCGENGRLKRLEQAFKAADILIQNGSFGLIAVDISDIEERVVRRIPLTTWFRFSRVVENRATALVFFEQHPHATNCAGLVLQLKASLHTWPTGGPSHAHLFRTLNIEAEVTRSRMDSPLKKPMQSAASNFLARTEWA